MTNKINNKDYGKHYEMLINLQLILLADIDILMTKIEMCNMISVFMAETEN